MTELIPCDVTIPNSDSMPRIWLALRGSGFDESQRAQDTDRIACCSTLFVAMKRMFGLLTASTHLRNS